MEKNNHDENCLDFSCDMLSKSPEKIVNVAKKDQTLQESPCHNHRKPLFLKIKSPFNIAPLPSAKHLTELRSSQPFSNVQNLSLVSHNSSSSPLENIKKVVNASTVGSSPHIPVKGILKSTSNTCKDQCYCEKCASTRLRAKKASEFSQRQMQDIEGIAAMLMKDLSTLREIVEDKLIKRSAQPEDVHSSFSTDEVSFNKMSFALLSICILYYNVLITSYYTFCLTMEVSLMLLCICIFYDDFVSFKPLVFLFL